MRLGTPAVTAAESASVLRTTRENHRLPCAGVAESGTTITARYAAASLSESCCTILALAALAIAMSASRAAFTSTEFEGGIYYVRKR